MSITLGDLITDIRNRADLNNSEFITNEEMTSYINFSFSELNGLLVNSFGGDYLALPLTASYAAGKVLLPNAGLPVNPDGTLAVYKIIGVDLCLNGFGNFASGEIPPNRITLQPFNFNERNRANTLNQTGYATLQETNYRYKVMTNNIMLQPPAASQVDLLIWYVPNTAQFQIADPLDLTQSPFLIQVSNLQNWLEYVIVDVCIKCKQKEDTDATTFIGQKNALINRIRNEAQYLDITPAQVTDVYANGTVVDVGSAGNSWGSWGY